MLCDSLLSFLAGFPRRKKVTSAGGDHHAVAERLAPCPKVVVTPWLSCTALSSSLFRIRAGVRVCFMLCDSLLSFLAGFPYGGDHHAVAERLAPCPKVVVTPWLSCTSHDNMRFCAAQHPRSHQVCSGYGPVSASVLCFVIPYSRFSCRLGPLTRVSRQTS
jgi:hypothetical protein